MALEHDTEEIEGFALVPARGGPDIGERGSQGKFVIGAKYAQPQTPVVGDREQMDHHPETPALPGSIAVSLVIDTAKVDQLLETQIWMIAKFLREILVVGGIDFDGELAKPLHRRKILLQKKIIQPPQLWRHRAMVLVLLILFCSCRMP